MVNRDDLLDGGAEHVASTVSRLRALRGDILIETLVGDFSGRLDAVDVCADARPDVFAHNVEVVRRLTRSVRDVRSGYDQSLRVLERAGQRRGSGEVKMLTKSSIMVGMGETDDEVLEAMRDLRSAGVDIVTLGQYLRPTPKHHDVLRFVPPDVFADYERAARDMGFLYAASGPLVRSSYKAAEVFVRSLLRPGAPESDVQTSLEERLGVARREARRLAGQPAEGDLLPASSLVRGR
jgi:lipoyl synthase